MSSFKKIKDLNEYAYNIQIKCKVISKSQVKVSKSGSVEFFFFNLQDESATINCISFEKGFHQIIQEQLCYKFSKFRIQKHRYNKELQLVFDKGSLIELTDDDLELNNDPKFYSIEEIISKTKENDTVDFKGTLCEKPSIKRKKLNDGDAKLKLTVRVTDGKDSCVSYLLLL
ncbi:uncharacterized protein [Bemisia tabaci]|uniref:uncharacterized protein n=1 Tax=Bemisia tabaci TaxID=7038 RepID=UPI003B281313